MLVFAGALLDAAEELLRMVMIVLNFALSSYWYNLKVGKSVAALGTLLFAEFAY